jgi:Rhodopirellula transposase DDE domain
LPDVLSLLIAFIERHKAGSPTDLTLFWIPLKPKEIALKFEEEYQIKISHGMVKRQLLAMNFKYRKLSKQLATGKYSNRDKQFQIIFTNELFPGRLVAVMSLKTPVLSIDCKKKERLGNLYRAGKCYAQAPVKVYDHDYDYLATGKVIPHGIYDLQRNEGYISLGNSHETVMKQS